MSTRTPTLRRRPARVIPSVLVCLLILVPAGLAVWAIIIRLRDGRWPTAVTDGVSVVLQAPLSSPGVLTAAVIMLALGLVLVLCAVIPGRHRVNALNVPAELYDGVQETVLTHRGLANLLEARTSRLDGVDSAHARVSERRVRLQVTTPLTDTSGVTDHARSTAEKTLRDIPLALTPTMTVRPERNRR